MLWLQVKYAKLLSYSLGHYKEKSATPYSAHFRCPLCGDSKKKKSLTRGSFYTKTGCLMMGCFNCGASYKFDTFLKMQDANLYDQFRLESFKENVNNQTRDIIATQDSLFKSKAIILPSPAETEKYTPNIFEDLQEVKSLDKTNIAYQYLTSRKFDLNKIEVYYTDDFFEWTRQHTDKFKRVKEKHPRIILPYRDSNSRIIGYTARALDSDQAQKYIRIFITETKEPFFGIDKIDKSKQIYVLEGELDSLCLPNSIAVAGGKLQRYLNKSAVYIPDKDTRNAHILKNIEDMIDIGLRVCLLPDIDKGKDINEMIMNGLSVDEIRSIIESNVVSGISGKLKFTKWKRI